MCKQQPLCGAHVPHRCWRKCLGKSAHTPGALVLQQELQLLQGQAHAELLLGHQIQDLLQLVGKVLHSIQVQHLAAENTPHSEGEGLGEKEQVPASPPSATLHSPQALSSGLSSLRQHRAHSGKKPDTK